MCLAKYIALFAKTKDEYIKHLETELLDNGPGTYHRCDVCERVGHEDDMLAHGDYWACEGRCDKSLKLITTSSDEDLCRKFRASEYER